MNLEAENARLRLAIQRIFRDRREADKIAAECLSVMPELVSSAKAELQSPNEERP